MGGKKTQFDREVLKEINAFFPFAYMYTHVYLTIYVYDYMYTHVYLTICIVKYVCVYI
jgi:hypothetical protein